MVSPKSDEQSSHGDWLAGSGKACSSPAPLIPKLWLTQADICEQLGALALAFPRFQRYPRNPLSPALRALSASTALASCEQAELIELHQGAGRPREDGGTVDRLSLAPMSSCQRASLVPVFRPAEPDGSPPAYVAEMVQMLDQLSEQTALLKFDLAELEKERGALIEEGKQLRETQYQLLRGRDEVEAERDLLSLELTLVESQRNELERQYREMEAQRDDLLDKNKALALARDELARQCDQLAHDRDRLMEAVQGATAALRLSKEHIRDLDRLVYQVNSENGSLRMAIVEAVGALQRNNQDIRQLHRELEHLHGRIAELARSPLSFPIRSRLRALIAT